MQHLSILRLARAVRSHVDGRLRGRDTGAIATIVAVVFGFGVILGCAALTFDSGSLMWERRQLQNGADAASLAAARVCARTTPCTPTPASVTPIAGANAFDGTSTVDSVCGSAAAVAGNPALGLCPSYGANPPLVQCPALPTAFGPGTKYVEVRTSTRTAGGSSTMPRIFAGGGYTGETVRACARAAWVAPTGGTVIPITISTCEYNNYTANGTNLVTPPPYTSGYPGSPLTYEHALYFHDTSGSSHCPAGPSGADLPGGFGWLDNSTGCAVSISATGWVADKPGTSIPNGCDITAYLGQTVYLPIYINTNNLNGSNGQYLVDGFAAFFISGMRFPSVNKKSIATNRTLCTASQHCLYGWFTTGLIPRGQFSTGSTPTPRGATTVVVAG